MYISRFQVGNYKSFDESASLELKPGFNIITGQNNAGKTALTEALSLAAPGNPHRSLRTVPAPDIAPSPVSWINIDFTINRDELFELLLSGPRTYHFAIPANDDAIARGVGYPNNPAGPKAFVEALLGKDSFTFALRQQNNENAVEPLVCREIPSFGTYRPVALPTGQPRSFFTFEIKVDRSLIHRGNIAGLDNTEVGAVLGGMLRSHIYRFSAERFNVGSHQFGLGLTLRPDASNLPEVLNSLQANVAKFSRLNQLVSEVLPQVRKVSVRPSPKGGNIVEVLVWTVDPASERIDLARPLAESGTGIGQVLAMLYVALTAVRPQIVIVDEPQSFLHPGAIRKLIEVLKMSSKHQFIIATHSPTVITSANPATISLLRSRSGRSEIERIDINETKAMAAFLNEIGARLSDVFGADNVLWVEGATEELCFPSMLEKIAKRPLMGTTLLGVRQVGDLEGRDAERIFEIYSRLSQGSSLLPPAIGFLFDAECRTRQQVEDLRRRSRGRVNFLPRRMFENYLLIPDAIVAVINSVDTSRPAAVRVEQVERFIDGKRADPRYLCPAERIPLSSLSLVDGARVLKELFSSLTETRVAFQKTDHSVALADWLIDHKPDALKEVVDALVQVLDANQAAPV